MVMYAYLSFVLFNRSNFFQPKRKDQSRDRNTISNIDQRRDTLFCIAVAITFILCSFPRTVGWLPPTITLLNQSSSWLLVVNSQTNSMLYFWKSYLSNKRTDCV